MLLCFCWHIWWKISQKSILDKKLTVISLQNNIKEVLFEKIIYHPHFHPSPVLTAQHLLKIVTFLNTLSFSVE